MTEEHQPHSPLGASGAGRWMKCHGSVSLLARLKELQRIAADVPESEEEDWTREGLALHEASAYALTEDLECWELVGMTFHDTLITAEFAKAIETYVTYCRSLMAAQTFGIEYRISSPVHPDFYGTADFWALAPGLQRPEKQALHVPDLKGGIGIIVEVEGNVQCMYYAFGVIDGLERQRSYVFDDDMEVVLTIAQPRGWVDPKIRIWSTTVGEIKAWVHKVLVPHMLATAYDNALDAGQHCRFCPAKLVCPMLTGLFKAACMVSADLPTDYSDAQLGLSYPLLDPVKFYAKALEKEALRRMSAGKTLPVGDDQALKLVHQKTNRTWKDGAALLAMQRYGVRALEEPLDRVVTEPQEWMAAFVKSPAQLEKLPEAAAWVKEFSFQPTGALTVALPDDRRSAVPVARLSQRYEGVDLGEAAGQSE